MHSKKGQGDIFGHKSKSKLLTVAIPVVGDKVSGKKEEREGGRKRGEGDGRREREERERGGKRGRGEEWGGGGRRRIRGRRKA